MDVDIDFRTDFDPLDYFETAIRASRIKDGELVKHGPGSYLQTMPADKLSGLAAIPYDVAEELGYTKIDFLHLVVLDHFQSKDEIRALLKIEPDWFLLESAEVVGKLFQLHRHFDIVYAVKPRSVQELADCIALIRPGKRNLLNAYLKNREKTRPMLYRQAGDDKSSFRRSHSIAYALTVVLQLHLIRGKVL